MKNKEKGQMMINLITAGWEYSDRENKKIRAKEAELHYDFYDHAYSLDENEKSLFEKKWETMQTPYSVRENLKYFFAKYLIGLVLAYGVGCGIRALNPNLPKDDKSAKIEQIMTPYAKAAIPLNTVWLAFWAGAFLRNHKKRKNYFAESEYYDLHMLERLCHEKRLSIDQICAGDARYAFELVKLDRRYIDGVINGDYKRNNEQLTYLKAKNIKGLIIAHLRQYPEDYEKIVSAMVGKHNYFTPKLFERLKGLSTEKVFEEYLIGLGLVKTPKTR